MVRVHADGASRSHKYKPSGQKHGTTNGALQRHRGIPLAVTLRNRRSCVTPTSTSQHPFNHEVTKYLLQSV